ncbi:hypothetical protein [Kitasatospora cineracea]|uniref:hypothetical protein n=1 Tax=Kitasatospora cineracea TaxID=88074 RepID=UPI003800313C
MDRYTVVLDWGIECSADPVVEHVWARTPVEALGTALHSSWDLYAGEYEEIPAGVPFSLVDAYEVWSCMAVLRGHAEHVRF